MQPNQLSIPIYIFQMQLVYSNFALYIFSDKYGPYF